MSAHSCTARVAHRQTLLPSACDSELGRELFFSNVKGSEYTIQGLDIYQLLDILIEEGIING